MRANAGVTPLSGLGRGIRTAGEASARSRSSAKANSGTVTRFATIRRAGRRDGGAEREVSQAATMAIEHRLRTSPPSRCQAWLLHVDVLHALAGDRLQAFRVFAVNLMVIGRETSARRSGCRRPL
jgi:hypothetical protein